MREYLIGYLLEHYQASLPETEGNTNNVYVIQFDNSSEVNVFQDAKNNLHLMTELGQLADASSQVLKQLLSYNDFNVSNPNFVLGLDQDHKQVTFHSRENALELNKVQTIQYFENFIDKAKEIQQHFKIHGNTVAN